MEQLEDWGEFTSSPVQPSSEEASPEYEHNIVSRSLMGLANLNTGFVNDFITLGEDIASWVSGEDVEWFDVPDLIGTNGVFYRTDLGVAGEVTKEIGTFALGMLATATGIGAVGNLGKAGKLGKLGKLASWVQSANAGELGHLARIGAGAAEGAALDFTLADTQGGNLSNLLSQFPVLQNPVTDYLKHDGDDSELEKRLKNALEGIPLGAATDYLFGAFRSILKYKRAVIDEKPLEEITPAIEKEIGLPVSVADDSAKAVREINGTSSVNLEVSPETVSDPSLTEGFTALWTHPEGRRRTAQEIYEEVLSQGAEAKLPAVKNFIYADDAEQIMSCLNGVREVSGRGIMWDDAGNRIPVRSLKETKEQAIASLPEVLDELNINPEGFRKLAHEVDNLDIKLVALRRIVHYHAAETVGQAKAICAGTATDLDKAQFLKQLEKQMEIQSYMHDISSGVGRALSSHRIPIGTADGKVRNLLELTNDELRKEPEGFLARKLKESMEGDISKRAEHLAKIIKDNAHQDRNGNWVIKDYLQTLEGLKGNKVLNVISEFRTTNILSGLSTQGVNVSGNLLSMFMRDVWEQGIQAGMGFMRRPEERVTFAEVLARVHGIKEGLDDFIRQIGSDMSGKTWLQKIASAGDTFQRASLDVQTRAGAEGLTDKALSSAYLNLNPNMPLGTLVDAYGKTARAVAFGGMNLTDAAGVNAGFWGEMSARIHREAFLSKIPKAELPAWKETLKHQIVNYARCGELPQGLDRIRRDKIVEIYEAALHWGRQGVFKDALKEGGLSSKLYSWLNSKDSIAPQVAKAFFLPFFKTPVNILDFAMARTPIVRRWSKEYQAIMHGTDQIAKDRLTAQVVGGSMLYMGAAGLCLSGEVTGKHPVSERDDLIAAGIPEYSIRLGNRYYQYNRLDPIGMFLGIVADLCTAGRHLSEGELMKASCSTIMAVSGNVLSKSYMKGIGDVWNAVNDPQRYFPVMVQNQIGALVPLGGAQNTINQVVEPEDVERHRDLLDVQTYVDAALSRVVGRPGMEHKVDSLGLPVVNEPSPAGVIFGVRSMAVKDPVYREMAKYKIYPTDRPGTVDGIQLTTEQHAQFKQIMGKDFKVYEKLKQLISSDSYHRLNNPLRKQILSSVLQNYRGAAAAQLKGRDAKLLNNIINKKIFVAQQLTSNPEAYAGLAETLSDVRDYQAPEYLLQN